jgi:hypothetical protein
MKRVLGGMAQKVENLPSKGKLLSSNPRSYKQKKKSINISIF